MSSTKRPHTPPSTSSPYPTSPTPKAARFAPASGPPLYCTLPPTCHPPANKPTALVGAHDLEAHYAKYHAHVCEVQGCRCVFPDARLLELHLTECHDPLAALRQERGEKIFACHLASCPRLFASPKTRRMHLIQAHGFPKQYFFAVTNKGVGGLLRKWGDGVSLVRGEWKAREGQGENGDESDEDAEEEEEDHGVPRRQAGVDVTEHEKESKDAKDADGALDALAGSMSSLSLVPSSVRFGRGGRGAGFVGARHTHGTGANAERADDRDAMPVSPPANGATPQNGFGTGKRGGPAYGNGNGGGQRGRGRGRGGFVPPPPRGGWLAGHAAGGRGFVPRGGFRGGAVRGLGRGRGA